MADTTFIGRLRRLTCLAEEDLSALVGLMERPEKSGREHALANEGDAPRRVHILEQGYAARVKMLSDGQRHICGLLLPGDLCDIDALYVSRYDYGVVTLAASNVIAMDRQALSSLCEKRPTIARALTWLGFVDNSMLNESATSLALRSAIQRLAHLFGELNARLGAIGRTQADGYDLPITQERLAETVGLTSVHVNRTLRDLRERGLARFQQGRVIVPDWGALKRAAGFFPNYLHLEGLGTTA